MMFKKKGVPGGSFIPFWNLIHHFINKESNPATPISITPIIVDVIYVNSQIVSHGFSGFIDPDNDMNLSLDVNWVVQGCFQQFHLGVYRPVIEEFDAPKCQKLINGFEACFKTKKELFYITPQVKLSEPYKCQNDQGCIVKPSKPAVLRTTMNPLPKLARYNLDWNQIIIPTIDNFVKIGETLNFLPNITVYVDKGANAVLWYKYIGWHNNGTLTIKNSWGHIIEQAQIEVLFPILINYNTVDGIYGS